MKTHTEIEQLGRVKSQAVSRFKEHQPLHIYLLLLLLAVFTQSKPSCWWQADRNVSTQ